LKAWKTNSNEKIKSSYPIKCEDVFGLIEVFQNLIEEEMDTSI
jgi:hypothetical protein